MVIGVHGDQLADAVRLVVVEYYSILEHAPNLYVED